MSLDGNITQRSRISHAYMSWVCASGSGLGDTNRTLSHCISRSGPWGRGTNHFLSWRLGKENKVVRRAVARVKKASDSGRAQ